jgi:GTPase SAR1 family protein
MSQTSDVASRAESICEKTLAVLTALVEDGRAALLPEPPAALEQSRRKLADNTYQVLVVGEAKRGKSTLVNALIGRSLLPTDVDIATSQVFRICPAAAEAYRLRFEDDSERAIAAADLPRFGSQVVADRDGMPRLDETIRWIEIDLPAKFLPPNVRILDTPGLGALYAAHAQITERFVPHADAVIFVLESQAPIGEPEIRFVEQLLGVTPNIFFVQTKIDQFRKEAWQAVLKRNHEILQQRFGERLRDARVWPVSSTNLAKVAATNDADYLQVSRYQELATALQAFLFRIAGWERAAVASVLAAGYHAQARAVLARRLASLNDDQAAGRQGEWAARGQQFATDWGEAGSAYQKLRAHIQHAASQIKRSFVQALQSNSSLEMEQRVKIDELQSAEQAREYAARLRDDVGTAVLRRWRQAIQTFDSACHEAIAPLGEAGRLLDELSAAANPGLSVVSNPHVHLDGGQSHRVIAAIKNTTWVWGAASTFTAFAVHAGLMSGGLAIPPLAVLAVFGVGIVAAMHAWQGEGGKQLKAAQEELHKHLSSVLAQIRLQFLGGDAGGGVVDDFFRRNVHDLEQGVNRLVRKKLADMDAEVVRLNDNARLDAAARAAKLDQTQCQLQQWDGLGDRIAQIQAELDNLNRQPAASAPA